VFAPHASLRARVTACAGKPLTETARATVPRPDPALPAATRRRTSLHWARLLARIYAIQPLSCPHCQGPMRLIAFIWTPPDCKVVFDVMIDRRRLRLYIRPVVQTEACGP
jgi:hypothetical protein